MNGVSKINNHDMVCVWVLAQQTVMESGDKVYQVVTKFTVSLQQYSLYDNISLCSITFNSMLVKGKAIILYI